MLGIGSHRDWSRAPTLPRLGFLTLVTVVTGDALTRFTTFEYTRYFLVLYALLLVPFFGSLLRLRFGVAARRVVRGAYAAALLASCVRTIEPVSRRLYGTFAFGTHHMLQMTRVTRECCGFGQDQLAYSLEFTVLQPLTDAALAAIDTARSAVTVVLPDSTSWIFLDPPGAGRRQFSYRGSARVKPVVLEHGQVVRGGFRPAAAFYLALPYGNNPRAMREMAPLYELRDERPFERGGYAIALCRMVPRGTAPQ